MPVEQESKRSKLRLFSFLLSLAFLLPLESLSVLAGKAKEWDRRVLVSAAGLVSRLSHPMPSANTS